MRLVPENEAQIAFCIREILREKTAPKPSASTAGLRALLDEVNEPTQSVEYLSFTICIIATVTILISVKHLLPVQKKMKLS